MTTLDSSGGTYFISRVIGLAIYFVPTIIAFSRHHRNAVPIMLL